LVISKDYEFLSSLRTASLESKWDLSESSSLREAIETLQSEYFPVVVLDQVACEGNWESCVSSLVLLRKPPCLILASQYGDEYVRLEMVRLGGYDVLSKSASREEMIRTIEFAWFWSQHSVPLPSSGVRAAISFPGQEKGPTA
jgi:ActR/RegA family two-component response regulator